MSIPAAAGHAIVRLVRAGFEPRERIISILCEALFEPGELVPAEVESAVDAALQTHLIAERSWPAWTDCDKLDKAFAALQCRGIVALQNAGFTQSDGYDDVQDVVEHHRSPEELIGYCFYHQQDLERAMNGGGLYLAFGPLDAKQENSEGPEIGRAVVEELQKAGLTSEWNGSVNQRIEVSKLEWKRHRTRGIFPEQNKAEPGFSLFYHDYRHGGWGGLSAENEAFCTLATVAIFMRGILTTPGNFLGLVDQFGETLQFAVEDDGAVFIDLIVRAKHGSMTKRASLDDCIAMAQGAWPSLANTAIPGATFMPW